MDYKFQILDAIQSIQKMPVFYGQDGSKATEEAFKALPNHLKGDFEGKILIRHKTFQEAFESWQLSKAKWSKRKAWAKSLIKLGRALQRQRGLVNTNHHSTTKLGDLLRK